MDEFFEFARIINQIALQHEELTVGLLAQPLLNDSFKITVVEIIVRVSIEGS